MFVFKFLKINNDFKYSLKWGLWSWIFTIGCPRTLVIMVWNNLVFDRGCVGVVPNQTWFWYEHGVCSDLHFPNIISCFFQVSSKRTTMLWLKYKIYLVLRKVWKVCCGYFSSLHSHDIREMKLNWIRGMVRATACSYGTFALFKNSFSLVTSYASDKCPQVVGRARSNVCVLDPVKGKHGDDGTCLKLASWLISWLPSICFCLHYDSLALLYFSLSH